MHLRLLALLCFSLLAFSASSQKYLEMIDAGTYTIKEIQQEAEAYFDLVGRERGSGYNPYKRWEYVALMELDDAGVKIPNQELARLAREYRRAEKQHQQNTEFSGFSGDWKELGPSAWNATSSWSPGVGRVTSIGIDVNNDNHFIVGSPTGGVWKTLDGCNTWTPLSDEFSTIDVYALEISPYDGNQYLWGSTSGKIFRSTDAGASWVATGNLTGNGRVSWIQYHPVNPNIVYATSESSGLFVSVNSGMTWTAVPGASGVPGYDMEFKPGDPNTIYFSGINVYRSTDGGASFSQVGGFGTANNNYKMMAVSAANPNIVYVAESSGGKFGAFYKSTDSGASFTKLIDGADINYFGYSDTGDDDKGQAPRNMEVVANPLNADEVHLGGIHTWKSIDGGVSFFLTSYWVPATAASLGVGYNHADINIIKFSGTSIYVGTDGGIYSSINGAQSFIDRTPGLGIREFYKIGVSKTNPNVVSGGSQDNGTSVMRGTNRAWVDWLGADGMETFVDWSNANNLYGTSQYGSMYRSTNQGTSRTSISKPEDKDGSWVTPFEQDPQVANTIYVAFADVWKTSNNGTNWTKISEFDNGNLDQMKLAPSNNQRIYVANGSDLFTTDNGGGAWTATAKSWGTSNISYIAVHPTTPERLLIVTSGSIYHSIDAGANWVSIGAGLPSGTKYCATWENKGKNGIYVGGFGYVAYTNDELGGQWSGFFDGLPNGRVYELEINYLSNSIFACTYGRGLWESPLYEALPPVAAFAADQREGCQERTVTFLDKSANSPTSWEWTFEGGTPASSTLQNPTVTFSGGGTYTVSLKCTNSGGESSLEKVDYINLVSPSVPIVADVERCEPGEVSIEVTGHPASQFNWYASDTSTDLLFTGDVFTTNIAQTTTFYVATTAEYFTTENVGPVSNLFGGGSNHGGDQYLIVDAIKPFRLKSAIVYANGAGNRTFRLRDAAGNVLLNKTVFVNDGESRVTLDMDIPQGADLRIGCISPANLFRNSTGVSYPYSIPGVMQIKSSTAGLNNYFYLYDIEVEIANPCESERVPVTGIVRNAPSAPTVAANGPTTLCPGQSVVLTAENICPTCTVKWSNGASGPSINVSVSGSYTATVRDTLNACGDSPASDAIVVTESTVPVGATLVASGSTELCPGESVLLTAENICPDCTVNWSNGETGTSIMATMSGIYTAIVGNTCGENPASNSITVSAQFLPDAPVIGPDGTWYLCPGDSVVLSVENICADCLIKWSNGETAQSITVSTYEILTATVINTCGESPASNVITVEVHPPFLPQIQVANLCDMTAPIGSDYQWFLNGVLIPGVNGQFWSAEVAGNYVVTMKDPAGCIGTSEPVFAEPCISSIFNVGGNMSARIYPNPAQDRVSLDVHLTHKTNAQLDLYAADGRMVGLLFQGDILPGGQILDIKLPDLPAGVYQYRLVTELGSLNGNLVVQRR